MATSINARKENPPEFVIGMDLGATRIRLGAFQPDGALISSLEGEIRAEEGPDAGLERIASLVENLLHQAELDRRCLLGIGIGSTGPVDSRRGLLVNPGTMPGWLNVPIVAHLQDRFHTPVCLENDADAAALGEYWQGVGHPTQAGIPPVRRLYAITVGTGIGTAFILDGQVVRGADGFHPEGGHQIVDPSGPECYCGGRGCWESLCSGSAIGRMGRSALKAAPEAGTALLKLAGGEVDRIDARLVCKAARQGDPLSRGVIEQAAKAFALGVFNILMLFFPEVIVLSGGVMHSSDLFMPALNEMQHAASAYLPIERVHILPARLGYYAGVYGAAYALLQAIHHPQLEIQPPF